MELRTGLPEEAGMSPERVDRIHQLAASMVEDHITPAEVYLVARKGMIVAHRSYGKLTPHDDSIELPIDALFPICSITKTITAACIMILVEQGSIGLNRPVCDYLPGFAGSGKEGVRVHHLLTHTSGLNGDEMTAKPGEKMSYSGYGYDVLGEIIQRISNLSYTDFAKEHVFDPLGMKDSFFNVPQSERHRIVKRSPEDPCAEWLETEEFRNSASPSGGMYSTAYDLAIFGQMFLNKGVYGGRRILSPLSVMEMTKNQIPGISSEYRDEVFPEAYWGYGWAINGDKRDGGDLFSPQAYSHWGAGGPFIAVDPAYDIVTVYFNVERDLQKPFKNMYADYFNNTVLAAITDL